MFFGDSFLPRQSSLLCFLRDRAAWEEKCAKNSSIHKQNFNKMLIFNICQGSLNVHLAGFYFLTVCLNMCVHNIHVHK